MNLWTYSRKFIELHSSYFYILYNVRIKGVLMLVPSGFFYPGTLFAILCGSLISMPWIVP